MLIFFLVLTSFACGLNQLYWYYTPTTDGNPSSFYTLENSYRTLYWSLFSLTQLKDIKINNGQYFTEMVRELLFMVYHTMAVIVLINMLIAMMSNSFQEIENHADMEWKFSRSKLWMGYFDEGSTLPPPFNLVISPKSVMYFVQAVKSVITACCELTRLLRRPDIKSAHTDVKGFRHSENSVFTTTESSAVNLSHSPDVYKPVVNGDVGRLMSKHVMPEVKYADIMRRLVSRYIHQTKKQRRQDGVNEDDLLEIKQDISSLRYEIREDRRREVLRTETNMDTLRRDITIAIKNGLFNKNSMNGQCVGSTPNHNSNWCTEFSQSVPAYHSNDQLDDMTQQNKEHLNPQRRFKDTLIHNLDRLPQNQPKLNSFSTAKVESYLSHLGGDSVSSQTTDTYPLPNLTTDPYKSHAGEVHVPKVTSYGCRISDDTDFEMPNHTRNGIFSSDDLESIKLEIIASLRSEIRETARNVASDLLSTSPSGNTNPVPELHSDLYQTHLYTQL
ncbi:anthranilate synthase component II [Mactra antiquata]